MREARAFAETDWLSAAGQPIDQAGVRQVGSVEELFAAIYAMPFAGWKLLDDQAAEALDEDGREWVGTAARRAFEVGWERYPDPEVCALLSDDVHAILALLVLGAPLSPFTRERMEWYARGRFPCGYEGHHPGGTWLVR